MFADVEFLALAALAFLVPDSALLFAGEKLKKNPATIVFRGAEEQPGKESKPYEKTLRTSIGKGGSNSRFLLSILKSPEYTNCAKPAITNLLRITALLISLTRKRLRSAFFRAIVSPCGKIRQFV